MVMWLGVFGAQFVAMLGVDAGALHRIVVSASTTFDSLPHSPMLAQGMGVFKTNFKESYKYSFILTVVFPVIFSLFGVILAIIFY
jgi:H+/gluconate symporter-like permease